MKIRPPQEPGRKWCPRCEQSLLITDFYLASNVRKDGTKGRMHWCKDCHRKYSTQRRRNRLSTEGQAYRDNENHRVRSYMSQDAIADKRRATERAKQKALKELKLRHAAEYRTLYEAAKKLEGLSS